MSERKVRITRNSGPAPVSLSVEAPPTKEEAVPWARNDSAVRRSFRLFLLGFLVAPGVIAGAFLTITWTSSAPGVRDQIFGPALIIALLAVTIVVGLWLTILRTPRAFRSPRNGFLEVQPAYGRNRTYAIARDAHFIAKETYRRDLLNHDRAELVEVHLPPNSNLLWVVEEHLLDPWVPRYLGTTSKNNAPSPVDPPAPPTP